MAGRGRLRRASGPAVILGPLQTPCNAVPHGTIRVGTGSHRQCARVMDSGVMVRTLGHEPDILEVLRILGMPEHQLRKVRARRQQGRRSDHPRCGARRRDGGCCEMRAVCDGLTGRPLHGGRCRMHGGLSTGPRTPAGRAAIAESNRRRSGVFGGPSKSVATMDFATFATPSKRARAEARHAV